MRKTLLTALLVSVAAGAALAGPLSAVKAASYKSCGPAIQHRKFGKAQRIRLTKGFPCRQARASIRRWLREGASTATAMPPWRCDYSDTNRGRARSLIRCYIRTSFGGTKPLRRYNLGFIYGFSG